MKDKFNLIYINKLSGNTDVFPIKRGIKQMMLMIPILFMDSYDYNMELKRAVKAHEIPDIKRANYEILKGGLIWIE